MSQRRTGLTLIEVLVVVGLIALLIALMLPAIQLARQSAQKSACQNNVRQIGVALHAHEAALGTLPAGWVADSPLGQPGWGWATALLPYLEEKISFNAPNAEDVSVVPPGDGPLGGFPPGLGPAGIPPGWLRRPISDPANRTIRERPIPVYLCPSDPTPRQFMLSESNAVSAVVDGAPGGAPPHVDVGRPQLFVVARANYSGVFGTDDIEADPAQGNGCFFHNSHLRFADIRDGLSNTLLVGERSSRLGSATWVGSISEAHRPMARVVGQADRAPNDAFSHFENFSSHHASGVHFLLGDGSVRLLAQAVEADVYHALATRSGGEVVDRTQLANRAASLPRVVATVP